jgi:hypothetical protein
MDARLKAQIRVALFRCAADGKFPTYEEFYECVRGREMTGQFPFLKHFDEIAKEERKLGYPDITFIVRRKNQNSPYPSQIDFRSAKPAPDEDQLRNLRKGTSEIIRLYCPKGTTSPY